ncbi:GIY-YIG nuclease family protein [Alteromonas sp. RKMC-009]|uniref:GIY-YIG nuclease family protein n=1 Tax=Alteromonas sp. RKMC-009 TaxID=2267264 RepID=UPI001E316BA9|nr:GIY-YIG nuclease family protein [Alteromonas sp. RKMC-009]MEC7691916.1 GIY-YIG nuclease family protein [Pseudomonadota bacterium]
MQQSIPAIKVKEQTQAPSWYVYMVENRLGQFYTGVTTDPARRIRQHRGEIQGGAKALKGKAPLVFRMVVSATDKSAAMKAEYWLKQLSKRQKTALLDGKKALPGDFPDCTSQFKTC